MTVNEDSSSNEVGLTDVAHWLWSCQLQIRRLHESTEQESNISSEQGHLERRRICSQTSYDEHMIIVALRNLLRSLSCTDVRIPQQGLDENITDAIMQLRNIYEHWDEHRDVFRRRDIDEYRKSLKNFSKRFPEGQPWSMSYGPDGPVLGNVINIGELLAALRDIEEVVLSLLDWHEPSVESLEISRRDHGQR